MSRNRHHTRFPGKKSGLLAMVLEFWDGFWNPPDVACPKCRSADVEYYDPFFFSLGRTLSGRRRFQFRRCYFVWRKSRSESPLRRSGLLH